MGIGVLVGLLGAVGYRKMASKMSKNQAMWTKSLIGGAIMCIGGPALVMYVMPTEEALIEKYNPELKARALKNREQRQQQFDDFASQLKEYSKSDKHIWDVAKEHAAQLREQAIEDQKAAKLEAARRKEEIRQQALSGK